jgi:hypothetical protein
MSDVDRSLLRVGFVTGILALAGLIVLILLMSGCAMYSQSAVNALVGKPYGEAEIMFGEAPAKHVPLPEGGGIYTWEIVQPLTSDDFKEIITVWVGKDGKVIRAQWKKRRP